MTKPAPDLLFSLFQIGNMIQRLNKDAERKSGLSLVQWALLSRLIDLPGVSALTLARAIGVHPSTLTQTLKRLEKKGCLAVSEDPRDSRKKIVSITRAGKDLLESATPALESWLKTFDSAQLIKLLNGRPGPESVQPAGRTATRKSLRL